MFWVGLFLMVIDAIFIIMLCVAAKRGDKLTQDALDRQVIHTTSQGAQETERPSIS